jgi:CRISPR-associated protein Cmr2
VPALVEDKLTYLVYAGGDDVLAFVALDDAACLARTIRLAFGGHMEMEGGRPVTGFDKGRGFWLAGSRVVQTLGRRATISGALVIFHHKYPLQAAVEESRRAQEWAKQLPGKDALALVVIRRSGQQTRCRLRWTDVERREDALRDLGRVSDRVRQHLLSPRFHGTLKGLAGRADARSLPVDALELLVRRAVERHWDGEQAAKEEQQADETMKAISRLRGQAPSTDEWLAALEVAVFLARGGR